MTTATYTPSLTHRLFLRGIRRRGLALVCLALLALTTLACVFGPFLSHTPSATSFQPLQAPGGVNLMGTDSLGRDVLARVLSGGQISLIAGFAVAGLCLSVAVAVGAVAGFFGGKADLLLMRVSEVFQVVPAVILALVAAALFGTSLSMVVLILAMTMWPQVARIARAETMKIRELGYVESAFATGFGPWRILWSDVLPNAFPALLVATTMTAGRAILFESGLAFLGLGDANQPSWGALLNEAQSHLRTAWWLTVFPGAAIFLVVLSINLLGDVWNDNLNPTLDRVK